MLHLIIYLLNENNPVSITKFQAFHVCGAFQIYLDFFILLNLKQLQNENEHNMQKNKIYCLREKSATGSLTMQKNFPLRRKKKNQGSHLRYRVKTRVLVLQSPALHVGFQVSGDFHI